MSKTHFETPVDQSLAATTLGVFRAAYTVFTIPRVPGHDGSIYIEVAGILQQEEQPIQPPIQEEVEAIISLAEKSSHSYSARLNSKELLGLMGVLMQFMSYLPRLRPYSQISFNAVEDLYQACVEHGHKKPLTFADQMSIALEQADHDIPEALWRLLMTSRQYARWFDSSVIVDIPQFTRKEIIDRMLTWSRAHAACKPYGSGPHQDTSGDVYYCWTHALAHVAYRVLAAHQTPLTKLEMVALQNGTKLNHELAQRFKSQRLPSDHTVAAEYGNAIGDALVKSLNR